MHLRAAHLCDYAEVREGLLTIVSAGVTRLWRADLPAPMAIFVALQIELDASERPLPHELHVVITSPSSVEVASIRGGLQVQIGAASQFDADEVALVSLPLDLRGVGVAEYGWHTIAVHVDDQPLGSMRVKVAKPPSSPTGGPPPVGDSRRPN